MSCRPLSDQLYMPTACSFVTQKTAFVTVLFQPRDDTVTYSFQYAPGPGSFFETPQNTVQIFDTGTDPLCGNISPCAGDTQCIQGATLTDLQSGQGYYVTALCWENGIASPLAGNQGVVFTTYPAHTCATGSALGVSDTEAVLYGTVTVGAKEAAGVYLFQLRPDANRVRYKFEWGLTTSYGNSSDFTGPILATSDTEVRDVFLQISNLEPGTEYHFRVVAATDEITVNGSDQTFTTDSVPKPLGVM